MHIKKKNNLPIIVLYHCTIFHNCFASHIETVDEILSFCNNNAHHVHEENLSKTLDSMDTLIVKKKSKEPSIR